MLASSRHRAIEPLSRQSIEPASCLHRACIELQHRASIELSASSIEAGAQESQCVESRAMGRTGESHEHRTTTRRGCRLARARDRRTPRDRRTSHDGTSGITHSTGLARGETPCRRCRCTSPETTLTCRRGCARCARCPCRWPAPRGSSPGNARGRVGWSGAQVPHQRQRDGGGRIHRREGDHHAFQLGGRAGSAGM